MIWERGGSLKTTRGPGSSPRTLRHGRVRSLSGLLSLLRGWMNTRVVDLRGGEGDGTGTTRDEPSRFRGRTTPELKVYSLLLEVPPSPPPFRVTLSGVPPSGTPESSNVVRWFQNGLLDSTDDTPPTLVRYLSFLTVTQSAPRSHLPSWVCGPVAHTVRTSGESHIP